MSITKNSNTISLCVSSTNKRSLEIPDGDKNQQQLTREWEEI